MGNVSKPNTFSANTTISSSEVNSNFDTIYNEFNGSVDATNLAADAVTTAKIADANVTTAKLADSAVTPAKLLAGTGSTWAWQDFTPTWTNMTIGSATVNARYVQIGKTVFVQAGVNGAADTSISGAVEMSLPVSMSSNSIWDNVAYTGDVHWRNAATRNFVGTARLDYSSWQDKARFVVFQVNGSYVDHTAWSGSTPFAFGSGDEFACSFIYEAA